LVTAELFHYWSDAYHNERIHNRRPTNGTKGRPGTVPIVPFPWDFQAPELIAGKLHAETSVSSDLRKFINTWKASCIESSENPQHIATFFYLTIIEFKDDFI
jgi:hypothetical protein